MQNNNTLQSFFLNRPQTQESWVRTRGLWLNESECETVLVSLKHALNISSLDLKFSNNTAPETGKQGKAKNDRKRREKLDKQHRGTIIKHSEFKSRFNLTILTVHPNFTNNNET